MKESFPKTSKNESKKGIANTVKAISAVIAINTVPHSDVPKQPATHTYAERAIAAEQLQTKGITAFQQEAHKAIVSESLAKVVEPFEYDSVVPKARNDSSFDMVGDVERVAEGIPNKILKSQDQIEKDEIHDGKDERMVESRYDAWKMYLGLPQKHATFGISEYKPAHGKDNTYYYKLTNFFDHYAEAKHLTKEDSIRDLLRKFYQYDPANNTFVSKSKLADTDVYAGVMGSFKFEKGKDEHGSYIAYYDLWNLEHSAEGENGIIGKPFEIYDRIYYDPKLDDEVAKAVAVEQKDLSFDPKSFT